MAGGGTALPLRPELRPCLTGPPLPGWSLPLLGQQYLDTLTSWYCSFQDCCGGGDCRITNNFTGWNLCGVKGLGPGGRGGSSGKWLRCQGPITLPTAGGTPSLCPPRLPAVPVSNPPGREEVRPSRGLHTLAALSRCLPN